MRILLAFLSLVGFVLVSGLFLTFFATWVAAMESYTIEYLWLGIRASAFETMLALGLTPEKCYHAAPVAIVYMLLLPFALMYDRE